MSENPLFYLTHIVANPANSYDKWANHFLRPFHTLARTYWDYKSIHYYEVNPASRKVKETPKLGKLITRVTVLVGSFFTAIPGLLIGCCLKSIALKDPETKKSYKYLKWWLDSTNLPSERELFSRLPNECFNKIFSYVSKEDKLNCRLLSKKGREGMDATFFQAADRKNLKGVIKETYNDFSIITLLADACEYQQKYGYTNWIIQPFGNFKKILELPLYRIQGNWRDNDLLSHELDWIVRNASTDIFRVRLGTEEEWIIIKYTLNLPKEIFKTGINTQPHVQGNYLTFCYDYLILIPKSNQDEWMIRDRRVEPIYYQGKRYVREEFVSYFKEGLTVEMRASWLKSLFYMREDSQKMLSDLLQGKEIKYSYMKLSSIPEDTHTFIPSDSGVAQIETKKYAYEDRFSSTFFVLGHKGLC